MVAHQVQARTFTAIRDDGSSIQLVVRMPDRRELEAADLEFSGVFNQALLDGRLPIRTRMLRELRKNGRWTHKEEEQIQDIQREHAEVRAALEADKFESPAAKEATLARKRDLEYDLNSLRQELETMLSHTADSRADEARRNFLLACVIEKPNGERLWAQVQDLLNETDGTLLERVYYEYMTFINGVESEWERMLTKPEPAKDAEPTAEEPATEAADQVEEGEPQATPAAS